MTLRFKTKYHTLLLYTDYKKSQYFLLGNYAYVRRFCVQEKAVTNHSLFLLKFIC